VVKRAGIDVCLSSVLSESQFKFKLGDSVTSEASLRAGAGGRAAAPGPVRASGTYRQPSVISAGRGVGRSWTWSAAGDFQP
jgi:hypothetical protein